MIPLPPDLIALQPLRLSGSTRLFNKAACLWRSCKFGACGTCSPCNRQQNNSVRSSSHLKVQSLGDRIQIVLGNPFQTKYMTWQHSHGVFPVQRAYPVVCCVLSSPRTRLLLIKTAKSILWLTCSLYSLISLHWKRLLCWRSTETISLISLLQIQDFLGRIRFT